MFPIVAGTFSRIITALIGDEHVIRAVRVNVPDLSVGPLVGGLKGCPEAVVRKLGMIFNEGIP
jgi:hypothetical protein